ncbi:MAG: protein kinase [Planctomycetes bacterium]|nr:protein kinase [Planctomycetota bacterium]
MNANDFPDDLNEPAPTPEELTGSERLEWVMQKLERGETPWPQTASGSPESPAVPAEVVDRLQRASALFRRELGLLGQVSSASGETRDASGLPAIAEPLPDPFPDGYEVLKLLGAGAFGKVWLARDLNLGRRLVAVKTLKRAGDPQKLAALRHEAGILANLDHANIVQVHAWHEKGGEHFLVMQYVPGDSLAEQLERERRLPWRFAARCLADVAEGLVEVHRRGLVHRDIKPANILWHEERREAMLTDFGVAARLADGDSIGGTLAYMAPEGFTGEVSPKLDVYSLSVTLFHLLTGELPFQDGTMEELRAAKISGLRPDDPRWADVPLPLERVLHAGLIADPRQRPSLADFSRELRAAFHHSLTDSLALPGSASTRVTGVNLRLILSRWLGTKRYEFLATSAPASPATKRIMELIAPEPERVVVRTGDRVRIEVLADQPGYVTVFNVGPKGDLRLLYPLAGPTAPVALAVGHPLHVGDVRMSLPEGHERLFAVWSRQPLPSKLEQLHALTNEPASDSPSNQTSRNMELIVDSLEQAAGERCVALLELDHIG